MKNVLLKLYIFLLTISALIYGFYSFVSGLFSLLCIFEVVAARPNDNDELELAGLAFLIYIIFAIGLYINIIGIKSTQKVIHDVSLSVYEKINIALSLIILTLFSVLPVRNYILV